MFPPPATDIGAPALQRDWSFVASRPTLLGRLSRANSWLTGYRPRPPRALIRPIVPRERWTCYFLYLPDGRLTAAHLYTLRKLRELPGGLLVICAAPHPRDVPDDLLGIADALYWKGLSGYDFSAYSIALRGVAEGSPGADLFVMNDSVLGPFGEVEPFLARAPWELTGFTATSMGENHLQSYAFLLRDVTPRRIDAFGSAMPRRAAFNRYRDVINLQETRFARLASRRMQVGAFWYADVDPTLVAATALVADGFPFLKRSLLGRYGDFQDPEALRRILAAHGHPL